MNPIYYEDQTGWEPKEYYTLNRYLNRMFLHWDRRIEEISSIDISKLSNVTKVLICAIIKFQHKEDLLKGTALAELLDVSPLEYRINLTENPSGCHEIYEYYNIGL